MSEARHSIEEGGDADLIGTGRLDTGHSGTGNSDTGNSDTGSIDVTFYVPCLNEEENVGPAIENLVGAIERHDLRAEILVYDDGSSDRTSEVAMEALERAKTWRPDLRYELIRNETPRGLGANFSAGASRGHGDHYMLVNGDHSERAEALDDVLSRLGQADLIVTIFDKGDSRGLLRRGLSRFFTALVNGLNGHRLRYYNGPVLHRREDVVRLATDCRGFAYQAELLTRELDAGRSFLEVPMVNRQRESGVSKAFHPSNLLSVATSLWRIAFRRFDRDQAVPAWSKLAVLGLILPLLIAGGLRLTNLENMDIRADEIGLLLRVLQEPSLGEIYEDHLAQFAQFQELPASRLAARAVTSLTADVGIGELRLGFAIAGTLTCAALWWLGFEVGGLTLAVILAVLGALNPFHLFWSRVAYVYAFPILFVTLFYAGAARMTRQLLEHGRAHPAVFLATTFAAVLASYSHFGTWLAVLLGWGVPLAAWASRAGQPRMSRWMVWAWPGLWLAALWPWIHAWVSPQLDGSVPLWGGALSEEFWWRLGELWRLPFTYAFGSGWRAALSLGLPIYALLSARTRDRARLLALAALPLFVVLTVAQAHRGPVVREYLPLWPIAVTLSGLGLWALGQRICEAWESLPSRRVWFGVAGLVLVAGALAWPVMSVLQLEGSPAEYSKISDTLDELVASPGTPALINGQTVAEIEMRAHLPQKAFLTFAVLDADGFEQWFENRWRESAEDFLRRFGDAPLVQKGRKFYDHPLVGPWSFPENYFARRIALKNEPASALVDLSLAPAEDFYGGSLITEISYNLPEDLIKKARAEGQHAVALWGDGWSYAKTTDLRDWRLFRDRAEILVHNLTDRPAAGALLLDVQVGQLKRLRLAGKSMVLQVEDEDQTVRIESLFEPGENRIELFDELYEYSRASLRVASLRVELESAEPESHAQDSHDQGNHVQENEELAE